MSGSQKVPLHSFGEMTRHSLLKFVVVSSSINGFSSAIGRCAALTFNVGHLPIHYPEKQVNLKGNQEKEKKA